MMLRPLLGAVLGCSGADDMPKRGEGGTCEPPLRPGVQAVLAIRVTAECTGTMRGQRFLHGATQLLL